MTRACEAVGLSRATAYRHLRPIRRTESGRPRHSSARRIPDDERAEILQVLHSERFADQPPREVYATLLSEGTYLCSVSTMYRLLRERGPVHERRNHRKARHHAVPRLEATGPNQVWSWDISKLPTQTRGVFLNLYVVLDLFSRFVVAWMVAQRENSGLAKQLFSEAITRHEVASGDLVVHMDRGAPMTSHGFAELLSELGIDRSYSRPRVSNDNPFSESHFHTIKYQPDYPGRFRDVRHARQWCEDFFHWYNHGHHHDGLALFTPADVFHGRVHDIAAQRHHAMRRVYEQHPERFINGPPRVPRPPERVTLNPLDAAPLPSAERVLQTPDDRLLDLWPQPRTASLPVVNVAGTNDPSVQPQDAT